MASIAESMLGSGKSTFCYSSALSSYGACHAVVLEQAQYNAIRYCASDSCLPFVIDPWCRRTSYLRLDFDIRHRRNIHTNLPYCSIVPSYICHYPEQVPQDLLPADVHWR